MKKLNFSKIFIFGIFMTLCLVPGCVFAAVDVDTEVELKQAIVNGETEINLKDDIVLSTDVHSHASRSVGVNVKGEGTITINGNGYTLSSPLVVAMEVRANDGKNVKVVLNDITVTGVQRAIDIRSANVTLELNNAKLNLTGSGNYQALTVGGTEGPITVDINDNSVIDGGKAGYGIITFNPVNMTIDNSTVKGYAALYFKAADGSQGSAGSKITVTSSILEGNSRYSGYSDNFGTIVFEDSGIEINIKDSVIKAVNTGTAYQVPFSLSETVTNVPEDEKIDITVEGNSEIIIDTQIDDESLVTNYDNTKMQVVVKAGVTSNVEIDEEYLEEGTQTIVNENGIVTVVKPNEGGQVTPEKEPVKTDKENAKDTIENPETSDNILVSIALASASLIAIVGYVVYYKKRNYN